MIKILNTETWLNSMGGTKTYVKNLMDAFEMEGLEAKEYFFYGDEPKDKRVKKINKGNGFFSSLFTSFFCYKKNKKEIGVGHNLIFQWPALILLLPKKTIKKNNISLVVHDPHFFDNKIKWIMLKRRVRFVENLIVLEGTEEKWKKKAKENNLKNIRVFSLPWVHPKKAEISNNKIEKFVYLGRLSAEVKRVHSIVEIFNHKDFPYEIDFYGTANKETIDLISNSKNCKYKGITKNPLLTFGEYKYSIMFPKNGTEYFGFTAVEALKSNCLLFTNEYMDNMDKHFLGYINFIDDDILKAREQIIRKISNSNSPKKNQVSDINRRYGSKLFVSEFKNFL
ncbi:hypothetical protein MYMA111404_01470 [Mycoplasma marinum]|uniref:Glycosyl transferase family 1 domain-containing protein n=1 Tax=Mycoplasma marinum TaxID=1937190 RepID=A0A4R0XPM4_9MOLU|nr:hypothetical protein [Mycoplasma marinum]TCG11492.1 hypothetical protein C4B24_01910 [Mycoplasma marinum]